MSYHGMSKQEREHWEHEDGCQTPPQLAYAEAGIYLHQLNAECPIKGTGDWWIIEETPYYCRATDAYVGQIQKIYAFETRAKAEAYLTEQTKPVAADEQEPRDMDFMPSHRRAGPGFDRLAEIAEAAAREAEEESDSQVPF